MSDLVVTDLAMAKFAGLARVLIPAKGDIPGLVDLANFEDLVRVAVKACGYAAAEIEAALALMPDKVSFDDARAFSIANPAAFHVLSELLSGAYFMAPAILKSLGYPDHRQHPAEVEAFVEEYETGILEPVMERGPCFREVGRPNA